MPALVEKDGALRPSGMTTLSFGVPIRMFGLTILCMRSSSPGITEAPPVSTILESNVLRTPASLSFILMISASSIARSRVSWQMSCRCTFRSLAGPSTWSVISSWAEVPPGSVWA